MLFCSILLAAVASALFLSSSFAIVPPISKLAAAALGVVAYSLYFLGVVRLH